MFIRPRSINNYMKFRNFSGPHFLLIIIFVVFFLLHLLVSGGCFFLSPFVSMKIFVMSSFSSTSNIRNKKNFLAHFHNKILELNNFFVSITAVIHQPPPHGVIKNHCKNDIWVNIFHINYNPPHKSCQYHTLVLCSHLTLSWPTPTFNIYLPSSYTTPIITIMPLYIHFN